MTKGPRTLWVLIAVCLVGISSPVSRLSVRVHASPPHGVVALRAQGVEPLGPFVTESASNDASRPFRDIAAGFRPPSFRGQAPEEEIPEIVVGGAPAVEAPKGADPVVQRDPGLLNMPDLLFPPFEGISSDDNARIRGTRSTPPDTNGDVGPFHYVQTVNRLIAVYDKEGHALAGPIPNTALFEDFDACGGTPAGGDPIVLYDHLADRWLFSFFTGGSFPFHQCIAISTTGDPTDSWFRYDFMMPSTQFNDYPKFGVWPDGYYMVAGGRGVPGEAFAFERDKMLQGEPARMVSFRTSSSVGYQGLMPVDLDGPPPDPGTPNYFVGLKGSAPQALDIFEFHVDWSDPTTSTFGADGEPNASLMEVAPFSVITCEPARYCIPQPDTDERLDALSGRLVMYRAQYRRFPDHDAIVFNHTVDAGGRAGVRWYEVHDPGGVAFIYQQGTFAPDDGVNRWMGSAALDSEGDLAIGYSAASANVYPSIFYAGRLATDPLCELTQGEAALQRGSGSQTSTLWRWGDYSMLAVDPVDDCTFWYTSEYVKVTASSSWQTKVGAFRFPQCQSGSLGALGAMSRARHGRQRLSGGWLLTLPGLLKASWSH